MRPMFLIPTPSRPGPRHRVLRILILVLGTLGALPVAGLSQATCEMEPLADRYVDRWLATMRQHAGPDSVDRLVALYDSAVVYEHPRVGIRIEGREAVRTGMARFLGATRSPGIAIRDMVPGRDVVVLRLGVTFEARQSDGWTAVERDQVILLECANGVITRIIDYW